MPSEEEVASHAPSGEKTAFQPAAPCPENIARSFRVPESRRREFVDVVPSGEATPAGAGATSPAATAGGRPSAEVPRYRVVLRTGARLEPRVVEARPQS